jgi:branched-chain amino acid transport system permease protein
VRPLLLGAALLAVLALVPLVAAKYQLTLMIPFFSYGIALLGLNLLFGYTGLLSFGHAMFLGIGAYTAAVFTSVLRLPSFELILLTAALVGGLIALPIGALCVRYTKIFFGMLTLAFGMLFHSFLFKFYAITGGDEGMTVRRPSLLGQTFAGMDKTSFLGGPFYYYCLVLLALLGFLMWRIVRSPFGLHLRAIRENPSKAQYLGVRVRLFRLFAFVISGAYGAVGGAILAVNTGLADPELAYWTQSGNLVFMAVLGGFGNFLGPIVGALAFIFLQDELMSATQYWRFFMGAILALIVILLPRGITGLAIDLAAGPARRWWPLKARA